jgi:hypothetical protein
MPIQRHKPLTALRFVLEQRANRQPRAISDMDRPSVHVVIVN